MHTALLILRLLLASLFALAAIAKLADLNGSRTAVAGFGVPARLAPVLGTLLPFVELVVAAALIPASSARLGALGAAVLLGMFAAAIARSVVRGEAPDCHCFGQLHSEPAGGRSLARNALLMALAVFVAVAGWSNTGPSASAWIGRVAAVDAVALGAGLAFAVLAAGTCWALLGVVRQNGRLLVRIDELEARLDTSGAPRPAPTHHGLPLGAPAPEFSLERMDGGRVTLASLTAAELPVILLFTDPGCAPCNALLPEIAGWQSAHAGRLTIAVLSRGTADQNRSKVHEHGVTSVLLDAELNVYDAYEINGTPAAVLIDTQARIASGVAAGAEAITELIASATRDPSVPSIEVLTGTRNGNHPSPQPVALQIGAPAPSLALRDATGEPVSLSAADRDTLVLFWNPRCGFCERMLESVHSLTNSPMPGAPRLLLISSGSVAEHEEQALPAPIAVDNQFAVGAAFGATGTPSAVLIDRHGRIASGLAVGAPDVMALATTPVKGRA